MSLTKLEKLKLDLFKVLKNYGRIESAGVNVFDSGLETPKSYFSFKIPLDFTVLISDDFNDYFSYNYGFNTGDKSISIMPTRIKISEPNPTHAKGLLNEYLEHFSVSGLPKELSETEDNFRKKLDEIRKEIKGTSEYLVDIVTEMCEKIEDKDYIEYSEEDKDELMSEFLFHNMNKDLMTSKGKIFPKSVLKLLKEFNIELGPWYLVDTNNIEVGGDWVNSINHLSKALKGTIEELGNHNETSQLRYDRFIDILERGKEIGRFRFIPQETGPDKRDMMLFIDEYTELVRLDDNLKYLYLGDSENELYHLLNSFYVKLKDELKTIDNNRVENIKEELKESLNSKGLDTFIDDLVNYIEGKD